MSDISESLSSPPDLHRVTSPLARGCLKRSSAFAAVQLLENVPPTATNPRGTDKSRDNERPTKRMHSLSSLYSPPGRLHSSISPLVTTNPSALARLVVGIPADSSLVAVAAVSDDSSAKPTSKGASVAAAVAFLRESDSGEVGKSTCSSSLACSSVSSVRKRQKQSQTSLPGAPPPKKPKAGRKLPATPPPVPPRQKDGATEKILDDPVVPLILRKYMKRFLWPPDEELGQRPCSRGSACEAFRVGSTECDISPVVKPEDKRALREFLYPTPDGQEDTRTPTQCRRCLLCLLSSITDWASITLDAGKQEKNRIYQAFKVDVSHEGEFCESECWPQVIEDSFTGVPYACPKYCLNMVSWIYDTDENGKKRPCVVLHFRIRPAD